MAFGGAIFLCELTPIEKGEKIHCDSSFEEPQQGSSRIRGQSICF